MKINKLKRFSVLKRCMLVLSFAATAVATQNAAAMVAPGDVVKNTVNAIVNNIQKNRELYKTDNDALYKMVDETLVPAVHVPRMARLILGSYANSATLAQVEAFSKEFQVFLMRTYATALLEYTGNEKVVYLPVNLPEGSDRIVVEAQLISATGATYGINLHMSNRRDTQWRAFNIEVAGINFISTYRATFKNTLDTKGVEGLIADLKSKNAN